MLRQFSNRSLDGAVEHDGFDAESFGYIGIADGVLIKPIIDCIMKQFFAFPNLGLIYSVKKSVMNEN